MQHIFETSVGASARPRYLSKPEKFVAAGGDDICHVIIEGALASYHVLPDGNEQICAYYLPGDICGLSPISRFCPNDKIRALTPTITMRISLSALMKLADSSHAIGRALLREMSVETAIARQWIVNLGLRSASLRIAHLACELESRHCAVNLAADSSFRWASTQKDLAAATGLSVVHVNRSLQKLKTDGLVEWKSTTVRILDAERLHALVNFDAGYLDLGKPKLSDHLSVGTQMGMQGGLGEAIRSSSSQGDNLSAANGR